MKRATCFVLSLLVVFAFFTACSSGNPPATTTDASTEEPPVTESTVPSEEPAALKLSWSSSDHPGAPNMVIAYKLSELLEERTNGQITVEVYPNGSLFNSENLVGAILAGETELGAPSGGMLTNLVPWMSFFDSAYQFSSYEHFKSFVDSEVFEEMQEKFYQDSGLRMLAAHYVGIRHVNVTERVGEVRTPEDLKGVMLRAPNSEPMMAVCEAYGGTPVPIALTETYMAIQTGTVDGQENPISYVYDQKFYEVTKYIIETGHMINNGFIVVNDDVWQDIIDAGLEEVFMECLYEAIEYCEQEIFETVADYEQKLTDEGIIFIKDVDLDAFKQHARDYYATSSIAESWDMELVEKIRALDP